jgi:cysteine sulfinate desulfinase/cysteine desulfurase-like protein
MGMERDRALSCVRFSLGYASTDDDVDEALEQIPAAVDQLVGVP